MNGGGAVRSAVVINPVKVDVGQWRRTIRAALSEAGWPEPLWYETTVSDPGRGLVRRAIEAGAELVFVCGGDGTVRSCVGALAGTDVTMAVLPGGTGNLLAANLGVSTDPAEAVRTGIHGRRRCIDVGAVGDECFTVMAGMGLDAHMLSATPEPVKARLGWAAYLFGGIRHLWGRPMRVAIQIDDDPPLLRRARSVLVANVGELQGGIRLVADAVPDDGRLDVAVLTPRTLGHWLALGFSLLRRRRRVPGLEVLPARRVTITSDRPQSRELDGDVIADHHRLRVSIRPTALWLNVPAPPPGT
ncbi:MAG: diacylglycerol kinase family protein [Actinocatenispora sp.]